MSGAMGSFAYVSDNTLTYQIKGDASNAALTGGLALSGGRSMPGRMRPRYLLAQSPTTGRERKIVVYTPDAAIWTSELPGTINLFDEAVRSVTAVAHQIRARVGEKRYT